MKKINVLIVDDSAVVRNILKAGLGKFADINIMGTASDPYVARDMIVKDKPDVMTLDLEMPRMDGLEFVQVLMKHMPIPIIIVSSLVDGKCDTSLNALELGAVEVFGKPRSDLSRKLPNLIHDLAEKIRAASKCKLVKSRQTVSSISSASAGKPILQKTTDKVIAIGSSTGGTEAIRNVLSRLPKGAPGILIVQHMPEQFTKAFAKRLDDLCPNVEVKEAVDGDSVYPGKVLLSPGSKHMKLKRNGARYFVEVKDGPRVLRHRPSVEVLFNSVAEMAGKNAIGVILTGMGKDGAGGMLNMRNMGARTIAQNEESCVVYGMPKEAVNCGAVEFEEHLNNIAGKIVSILSEDENAPVLKVS